MCPSGRYRSHDSAAASEIRPAFDVLDADRDGKISRDDLKAFYSSLSSPVSVSVSVSATDDDIASMISAADADRNGFVEFEEFERVLGGRTGGGGAAATVLAEAFRVMDRDGDGRVGFEDLKAYLEWAGMAVGDDDVRAMITMGGGDASTGVGFEELVKILAVDLPKDS